MPLTVRKFNAQVKDPDSGNMIPAGLLSSDSLEAIENAESAAITAIETKGTETRASIPSDYTALSDEVTDLNTQLPRNAFDILDFCNKAGRTYSGITFDYLGSGSWRVHGTSTESAFYNLFASADSLPFGMEHDVEYNVDFTGATNTIFRIINYTGGVTGENIFSRTDSGTVTIPETVTGVVIRLYVMANRTLDETVEVHINNTKTNSELAEEVADLSASKTSGVQGRGLGCIDLSNSEQYVGTYGGVEFRKINNRFVLNGTATTAIRFKISGNIEFSNTALDSWKAESLGLVSGRKYLTGVSKMSGNVSGGMLTTVIYSNESNAGEQILFRDYLEPYYNLAENVVSYSEEFYRSVGALAIYIRKGTVLSNYTFTLDVIDTEFVERVVGKYITSDGIPSYYYENDYLSGKIADIRNVGLNLGYQSARFAFITDYHKDKNANNSPELAKKILRETGIKDIIFNGDYIVSDTTKAAGYGDLCDFLDVVKPLEDGYNVYYTTGNHEYNDPSAQYANRRIDRGAIYQLLNADARDVAVDPESSNAYYIDIDNAKIRIYGIDCEYDTTISAATRKFVFDSLLTVPEGYAVLITSHTGVTDTTATDLTSRFAQIMECCAAMNDGTSVSFNLGSPYGTVTYNFANKVRTFIGALTGHTHVDGYYIYDNRFPVIVTECDAWNGQIGGTERTPGTIAEQAFEIAQIDVIAKRIYLTRIGHGNDRVFSFGTNAGLIS